MGKQSFGEIIRTQRKRLGIKAVELAKRAGVTKSYISKVENHDLLPSPAVQHELSKILGIDLTKHYLKNKIIQINHALPKSSNSPDFKVGRYIIEAKANKTTAPSKSLEIELYDYVMSNDDTGKDDRYVFSFLKKACPEKANDKRTINATKSQIRELRKAKRDLLNQIQNIDGFLKKITS